MNKVTLFWFRRDLRIKDNAALFYALRDQYPVQPVFIFDTEILEGLPVKDARVEFIHREINRLYGELKQRGGALDIRYGNPYEVWITLLQVYQVAKVYANRDYEPYARGRDQTIHKLLEQHGVEYITKKDHVIFEKEEVLKKDHSPYTVYTPYSKVWKEQLKDLHLKSYASDKITNWHSAQVNAPFALDQLGFQVSGIEFPSRKIDVATIENYHQVRDIPSLQGTTRLGAHLRFGTISIRDLADKAVKGNPKFLNELIWREFYISILWHFPKVVRQNFKRKYDGIQWRNEEEEFKKWTLGRTGYPLVDAGMRQLNRTGYMHNRVRMMVASFLTKHLLIDWRWGEAYFAEKLLDYELASNNGGWQWAAGTGVDAAPYFRIFNPCLQMEKFDPKQEYVRKWLPELGTEDYPGPMVDHQLARQRAIDTYKKGLESFG